jgi:RNA polymerase sigma-70 factor (ECF subfamily)
MEFRCAAMAGDIRWHRVPREQRYQFDRAYLDRLAAGDPETERHFTQYFGELLSIKLRSRLRSAALIEDVRQETFVRVLAAVRSRKGIGSPGGFGAFVNSVCNNVLFETYRAHGRLAPMAEDGPPDLPDTRVDAETGAVRAEEQAHVREVLKTLPPKEQQLLNWLFFEECDKDEVCRRLQVDRDYLRVLLHRAKQRFKTEFVGG